MSRQKLRRARDGGQRGSRDGYFATLHHLAILISIKRCRISGLAFILNLRKHLSNQVGNQRLFQCCWDFRSMRLTGESRFASLQGDSKVLEMHGNVILKFLKRLIRTTGGPKQQAPHVGKI
jgi:hypothetical protein